jgi:hypothetical protein
MAQWKETLEPYIKVNERIRTTTIVPTAGEDLIIGATIISDSGPSYPVLITSQREFLNVFASQEITKGYIESLNNFYEDGSSDVASTMWLNAYRLAGSTNMLIVRATKGADMNYVVPVSKNDNSVYIVRDGQLLKKTPSFCLTIDRLGSNANSRKESGWAISVNEIGIIGNLMSDDGPVYEYFASDLRELVEYLNGTSKFFSPKYKFYKYDSDTTTFVEIKDDTTKPDMVEFEEVYLAQHFIDITGFGVKTTDTTLNTNEYGTKADGLAYLLATSDKDSAKPNTSTTTNIVDLNETSYSGWSGSDNKYLVNTYNSNSDIRVRIRRFNHDAVILRDTKPTIGENEESPYEVIKDVIDQYNAVTSEAAKKKISERDFYEVAVLDPSLDKDPLSFCVGNLPGRGDLTLDELNDTLKMINLHINKMEDLELSYYLPSDQTNDTGGSGSGSSDPVNVPGLTPGTSWSPVTSDTSGLSSSLNGGNVTIVPTTTDLGNLTGSTPGDFVGVLATPSIGYVPIKEIDDNIVVDEEAIAAVDDSSEIFEGVIEERDKVIDRTDIPIDKANLITTANTGSVTVKRLNDVATSYILNNVTASDLENVGTPGEGGKYYVKLKGYDLNADDEEDQVVFYKLTRTPGDGDNQIYRSLGINTDTSNLLTVTSDDLMKSISAITEDEVYTTEGLTDLGNTDLKFQTYLCNMAKNENYFYPISTLYSTNYLAIANYRSRLAQDSYKLYTSAPWDIDSGTVGFKFHACPSVIYWEAVSRNRSMNREFASVFGFSSNGQVLYTNPVTEFTKKQRQLLLSKQVNTVMWNTQNQTWNMNDCYTMTSENHILNEDGNSRLFIRINKAIPTLLRPLIGRKLNNATYADAETILKYWFERTILTMQYSVSDYKVTIANLEANDDQARRQNKMYVLVECLFARSLKYVIVYSDALDMGMEFVGEIV